MGQRASDSMCLLAQGLSFAQRVLRQARAFETGLDRGKGRIAAGGSIIGKLVLQPILPGGRKLT